MTDNKVKVEWRDNHWHNDRGFVICPDLTLTELDDQIKSWQKVVDQLEAVRSEVEKKQKLANFLVTNEGMPAIALAEKLLNVFDISIKE